MALDAGLPARDDLVDLPMEVFDRVLDVNVRGVLLGIRAAVPALRTAASFITGVAVAVDGGITASTGQFLPRPLEGAPP